MIYQLFLLALVSLTLAEQSITFNNMCTEDIWVMPLTSTEGPVLSPGLKKMAQGDSISYPIPDAGWEGRFWPKQGCDSSGQNCKVGQSLPPCPPEGCQPPAETKIEFKFPPTGDTTTGVWYDISLVDGYTISMQIQPSTPYDPKNTADTYTTCTDTAFKADLNNCPTNENGVEDLRVRIGEKTVQCLSPCKKWVTPAPYGLGKNEQEAGGLGLPYCCPTPPVSAEQCQAGEITKTQYFKLIRETGPTTYGYAYDDAAGLHKCANPCNFVVNLCPAL